MHISQGAERFKARRNCTIADILRGVPYAKPSQTQLDRERSLRDRRRALAERREIAADTRDYIIDPT